MVAALFALALRREMLCSATLTEVLKSGVMGLLRSRRVAAKTATPRLVCHCQARTTPLPEEATTIIAPAFWRARWVTFVFGVRGDFRVTFVGGQTLD